MIHLLLLFLKLIEICKLQYEVVSSTQQPPPTQVTECEVVACGVFPFLQVTDVRSDTISRMCLWRWLNIKCSQFISIHHINTKTDEREERLRRGGKSGKI